MQRPIIAMCFLVALTGCAGSSSGAPPSSTMPTAVPTMGANVPTGTVSTVIIVPSRSSQALYAKNYGRRASYISTATQSAIMTINGIAQAPVNVGYSASINLGPYVVQVGSATFSVVLYSGLNGTGAPLSSATQSATINVGANSNVNIVLGGVVNTISVVLTPNSPANTASAITETITGMDYAAQTINGPFATPITLTSSDAVNLTQTTTTMVASSTSVGLNYSGACIKAQTITATSGAAVGSAPFGGLRLPVTNGSDSGAGSLRNALVLAAPNDIIVNTVATNTINLASNLPVPTSSPITVCGGAPGARGNLTINGGGSASAFSMPSGTLNLFDLTILSTGASNGSSLNVGGSGTANLTNVRIASSSAATGAIFTSGAVVIKNSDISNNATGGGIYINGGSASATITGSSLCNNSASNGGAISSSGILMLTNSTVCSNTAITYGGGLYLVSPSSNATLRNVTVTGNVSLGNNGGDIFNNAGSLTMGSSIIANGTASTGATVGGPYTSTDWNILDAPASGGASGAVSNNLIAAPSLAAVSTTANGNSIFALMAGSPAINRIAPTVCASNPIDQAGTVRPHLSANCAVGAFEP